MRSMWTSSSATPASPDSPLWLLQSPQIHSRPRPVQLDLHRIMTLLELPTELLEGQVCCFLDACSLTRLSLANRQLQHEITRSSELWAALVGRDFGLVNVRKSPLLPSSPRRRDSLDAPNECLMPEINWKRVLVAAMADAKTLAMPTLQESDVERVYREQKPSHAALRPCEAQIRQELVLMQGLRRFPTSLRLVRLYSQAIREAGLVPRVGAAKAAVALRTLAH